MYDATLVKTFQPIIPAGPGPVCEKPEDALRDILEDIRELGHTADASSVTDSSLEDWVGVLARIVSQWIDGVYTIFEDYKLVIKHYQRGYLDESTEFSGY